MSLTSAAPQPNLAWDFQSSNVDYVLGISPTTSVGPPTYNSEGKYGASIVFNNTPDAAPGTYYLNYTTGISLSTASGFTVCVWIKPLALGANSTGSQRYLAISDSQTFFFFGTNLSTSTVFFYGQNPFSVPNVIQGAVQTATERQWIHVSVVFSGTSITTYYNAVNKDNLSLVVNPVTFTALSLGNRAAISADQAAKCEIDDLRIFNTALSASQVNSIYAAQGMPGKATGLVSGSGTSNLVGQTISSRISTAPLSAFSLRAINGTAVRAVRVLRKSDNAQQDFWADRLGNLLTAPITGQPLQNWLGGSASNILTWYDQSGNGRDATGTQATIVRTSNVNQQWAINPANGGLSLSGGAFLNGTDFTITCTTKRLGTQGNDGVYGYGANASWVAPASVAATYGDNTRFGLVMPNAGSTSVTFNDSSYSAAFSSNANVLPSSFVAATEPTIYTAVTLTGSQQRMYINGTANGLPISTRTQLSANASTGFTIGTVNYYGNFLGEIGELIIFNTALSASDISTLYSAR